MISLGELLTLVLLAGAAGAAVAFARRSPPPSLGELEPAMPQDTDPEAPMMHPERCARLPGGHDVITRVREDGRKVRCCPRCGAGPHELRDFDVRR